MADTVAQDLKGGHAPAVKVKIAAVIRIYYYVLLLHMVLRHKKWLGPKPLFHKDPNSSKPNEFLRYCQCRLNYVGLRETAPSAETGTKMSQIRNTAFSLLHVFLQLFIYLFIFNLPIFYVDIRWEVCGWFSTRPRRRRRRHRHPSLLRRRYVPL